MLSSRSVICFVLLLAALVGFPAAGWCDGTPESVQKDQLTHNSKAPKDPSVQQSGLADSSTDGQVNVYSAYTSENDSAGRWIDESGSGGMNTNGKTQSQ